MTDSSGIDTHSLIVGGGLSGLHSAWRLAERGTDAVLVEARGRLGGRILSTAPDGLPTGGYDLGPTWFWPGQPRVRRLARAFGLDVFLQPADGAVLHEDARGEVAPIPGFAMMPESFRIAGGMGRLVSALAARIPGERIRLNTEVTAVAQAPGGLQASLTDSDGAVTTVRAQRIILAVPPRLAAERIAFSPDLSPSARRALATLPTWMAGHAKLVALYDRPVWLDRALSGGAISRRGPMMEIHDASPAEGGPFALFGFVGVPADRRAGRAAELKEAAAEQLARLFGVGPPREILLKDWAGDPLTAVESDRDPPAHHPAYGLPRDLAALWDGRLVFASSEVAREHGGLLEGALEASEAAIGPARAIVSAAPPV